MIGQLNFSLVLFLGLFFSSSREREKERERERNEDGGEILYARMDGKCDVRSFLKSYYRIILRRGGEKCER